MHDSKRGLDVAARECRGGGEKLISRSINDSTVESLCISPARGDATDASAYPPPRSPTPPTASVGSSGKGREEANVQSCVRRLVSSVDLLDGSGASSGKGREVANVQSLVRLFPPPPPPPPRIPGFNVSSPPTSRDGPALLSRARTAKSLAGSGVEGK